MKLLYSKATQQTYPYPRNDDQPIIGLDPDYLILERIEATPPAYDKETEIATPNWVVDVNALEYRQVWTVNEIPPAANEPNWDGFNGYMLIDSMFKSYRDIVRPIDGDLNGALFDSYGLVSTNGVAAFSLVWGYWCQVSGITGDDRSVIANAAHFFNLPADFVAVIRG